MTVDQLKELRTLGTKRVEFGAKGEIRAVEFFADGEPGGPGARDTEPVAVTVDDPHPEIPPDYMNAFDTLQKRPKQKDNGVP